MRVAVSEGAVLEAAAGGPRLGPGDKAAREVDARGVDLGILLREPTGIEAGAASELKDMGSGNGLRWEKRARAISWV